VKNFSRNLRGISPIFATLILIAIAVIAGVVVYMFTSGTLATMTGSTAAAQERVAVQGVQYARATPTAITVYAENMATSGTVTVNGLIIKDAQGNTIQSATSLTGTALAAGSLVSIGGTVTSLTAGQAYTVTVTTAGGGSFVSASFVAP
jgi:archaeal type IV pilus assembly protein PilA